MSDQMNSIDAFPAKNILHLAGLLTIMAMPLFAQGYAHGTAGVVITSSDEIVAAIDSKEVNREFLSDGTQVQEDRVSCKVRRTGPYYILIAGIARTTDGFDTLRAAAGLYQDGDTPDEFAARLAAEMPVRLAPILAAVRAASPAVFDESFRNQDVLQLTVLGPDRNGPRAIVISFRARQLESGRLAIGVSHTGCPGDCQDRNTIYLLGMRDAGDSFLYAHPEVAGDVSTNLALHLIRLEYDGHPDVVGGAATVLRVSRAGALVEQPGACAETQAISAIQDGLDDAISAVANVSVHEDIARYSKHGEELRSSRIYANVRVTGGAEEYVWTGPDHLAPGHPAASRLPQPWCGGELTTMLQVTRQVLAGGKYSASVDGAFNPDGAVVTTFHASEADRYWQLVLGSRTYPLSFDGTAWFSQTTGRLLRIRWEATNLSLPASAGITRVEWDENFSVNDVAGRPLLTPGAAVYRVTYSARAGRTDWTETSFSSFRRYGSTTNLQFEASAASPAR